MAKLKALEHLDWIPQTGSFGLEMFGRFFANRSRPGVDGQFHLEQIVRFLHIMRRYQDVVTVVAGTSISSRMSFGDKSLAASGSIAEQDLGIQGQ